MSKVAIGAGRRSDNVSKTDSSLQRELNRLVQSFRHAQGGMDRFEPEASHNLRELNAPPCVETLMAARLPWSTKRETILRGGSE